MTGLRQGLRGDLPRPFTPIIPMCLTRGGIRPLIRPREGRASPRGKIHAEMTCHMQFILRTCVIIKACGVNKSSALHRECVVAAPKALSPYSPIFVDENR